MDFMNEECGLESFKKVANKLVSSSRLGASDFVNEEHGLGNFLSKVVTAGPQIIRSSDLKIFVIRASIFFSPNYPPLPIHIQSNTSHMPPPSDWSGHISCVPSRLS